MNQNKKGLLIKLGKPKDEGLKKLEKEKKTKNWKKVITILKGPATGSL